MTLDEKILNAVYDFLDTISGKEAYKYCLVIGNGIYNQLTPEQVINIQNTIQITCHKHIVHNDFLPLDYLAMVNTEVSVGTFNRVHFIDIEGLTGEHCSKF